MDFPKAASALLGMLYEKPKPDHEAQRAIEAALKEAYNAGLEEAAGAANAAQHRITSGISHVTAQGHRSACWLIEQTIRAKKVAT
jgi:hypothetical protein